MFEKKWNAYWFTSFRHVTCISYTIKDVSISKILSQRLGFWGDLMLTNGILSVGRSWSLLFTSKQEYATVWHFSSEFGKRKLWAFIELRFLILWNWRRDFSSVRLYLIGITFEKGMPFLTPRQAYGTQKAVLTHQIWAQRTVLWRPNSLCAKWELFYE